MHRAAHLQNEAVASKAHVDNLVRERNRLRHRSRQAAENLASIDIELQDLTVADEKLQARLAAARQSLAESSSSASTRVRCAMRPSRIFPACASSERRGQPHRSPRRARA